MYIKHTKGAINGYVPSRIAKITDCSDKYLIKSDKLLIEYLLKVVVYM